MAAGEPSNVFCAPVDPAFAEVLSPVFAEVLSATSPVLVGTLLPSVGTRCVTYAFAVGALDESPLFAATMSIDLSRPPDFSSYVFAVNRSCPAISSATSPAADGSATIIDGGSGATLTSGAARLELVDGGRRPSKPG